MSVEAPWSLTPPAAPELPVGAQVSALGLDLISVSRLAQVLRRSPKLYRRVCAPDERLEWASAEGAGLAWAAALWVAKEASVKCLRTGFWRHGVDWPHLDVGGARAAELLTGRRDVMAEVPSEPLSEAAVWGAWRGWSEVSWRGDDADFLKLGSLRCCAQLRGDLAWGFAYLVAPNRH